MSALERYDKTGKEGAAVCQAAHVAAWRQIDVNGASSTAEMASRLARLEAAEHKANRQYDLLMKEAWHELVYEQCEQEAIGLYC